MKGTPTEKSSATIPLGNNNLGFGSNNNSPWFLPFGSGYGSNGYGFGFNGYGSNAYGFGPYGYGSSTGYSNTNGYYGVGSGGFGFDNLAGGGLYTRDTGSSGVTAANQQPASANTPEQQSLVIENAKAANSLYYQFRETNRAYRARQIARDRASPETVAKVALESLPRSLGPDEFEPATAKIAWPEPLLTDEYKNIRTVIEKESPLLSTSKGMESAATIREKTHEMVAILRTHIEEMPADDYMTARKFLDSVEYAAHKMVINRNGPTKESGHSR